MGVHSNGAVLTMLAEIRGWDIHTKVNNLDGARHPCDCNHLSTYHYDCISIYDCNNDVNAYCSRIVVKCCDHCSNAH